MEPARPSLGPHTSIVNTLRQYKKVPIAFLAEVLGRSIPEVEEYVATLEREGAVRREGETVTLAETDRGYAPSG